jgi:hypothetical protein
MINLVQNKDKSEIRRQMVLSIIIPDNRSDELFFALLDVDAGSPACGSMHYPLRSERAR